MKVRARKLQRILKAQQQLKAAEEWRMAGLERQLSASENAEREIIATLNDESVLHGLFLDTMARRLRRQSEETRRVAEARDKQSARLIDAARKLKSVGNLGAQVQEHLRRDGDKRELADLIETLLARGDASLR
jgi:hypothetical protein